MIAHACRRHPNRFGELRRRVTVQLSVLGALTAIVAAGVHLAVRG